MCQDTGTAIIMGKKGCNVITDGDDEAALSRRRARRLSAPQSALFAGGAAVDV
jgi:tartrate dehydratase alpha subunit/fumarate hydratase class I-like protein